MQIVLAWDKGIEQYQGGFKCLQIERPQRCLGCECGKFHKWGKYMRYVIDKKANFQVYIQRIRCVKCGQTSSYLPSFCVSGLSYGVDLIMAILNALIFKLRYSLDERKRNAYALLRRFRERENLWIAYLRAKKLARFPDAKRERETKIFTALLIFHKSGNFLSDFFNETKRHFMSKK
jgi:hypothetical protein